MVSKSKTHRQEQTFNDREYAWVFASNYCYSSLPIICQSNEKLNEAIETPGQSYIHIKKVIVHGATVILVWELLPSANKIDPFNCMIFNVFFSIPSFLTLSELLIKFTTFNEQMSKHKVVFFFCLILFGYFIFFLANKITAAQSIKSLTSLFLLPKKKIQHRLNISKHLLGRL